MSKKLIGIYKELKSNEEVLAETPDFIRVQSESNPFGTDFFDSKLYLTNQRLVFLIATDLKIRKAKEKLIQMSKNDPLLSKSFSTAYNTSLGQQKEDSSTIISTWMEFPLSIIKKIETPSGTFAQRKNQLLIEFDVEDLSGFAGLFRKNPKIGLHIDNRDIWKANLHNALRNFRIKRSKEMDGPRIDDRNRCVCSTCGTHYDEDKVKMVKCGECGQFVCKEKRIGTIKKYWTKTDCFDDKKFICMACKAKK